MGSVAFPNHGINQSRLAPVAAMLQFRDASGAVRSIPIPISLAVSMLNGRSLVDNRSIQRPVVGLPQVPGGAGAPVPGGAMPGMPGMPGQVAQGQASSSSPAAQGGVLIPGHPSQSAQAGTSVVSPGNVIVSQHEAIQILMQCLQHVLSQPKIGEESGIKERSQQQNQSAQQKANDSRAPAQNRQPVSQDRRVEQAPQKAAERPQVRQGNEPGRPAPVPSKQSTQANDWMFRLLSIQNAARNTGVTKSDNPSTASSAQLAVALSRIYNQFTELSEMIETGSFQSQTHVSRDVLMSVLATGRDRLQGLVEQMAILNENGGEDLSPAQMGKLLQMVCQEEGWMESLVATLKNAPEAPKSLQNFAKTMTAAETAPKTQLPLDKQPSPQVQTQLSPSEAMSLKEGAQLTPREAMAQALAPRGEQATELMQPRTGAELMSMVQNHVSKNPLLPMNVLVPYPMTLKMDSKGVEDVKETDELHNEGKKKRGSRGTRLGEADGQVMCLIPAGPVIVGDPYKEGRDDEYPIFTDQLDTFLLAATPVTNAQFAAWLNDQFDKKTVVMPRPGYIYDLHGRLLARTFEADPTSQIELSVENGEFMFRAQTYREHHPVVHVSLYGAKTFCETQGLALPSEAQWERAAGMVPTAYGQSIQKQRYGFKGDEVTSAVANYHSGHGKPSKENRTLPVGFFDGERVLTIGGSRVDTKRAVSPWGCFDMSGNVREWVDDTYDEAGHFYIAKGGSYADRPFDLRVSARIPLLAETTDAYTGFRAAVIIPSQE